MKLSQLLRILAVACVLALPGPAMRAAPDGRPAEGLRSLDLEDLKIQWFSKGEEELPAWINAHFTVGPLGQVTGSMTETELAADSADEDGDPAGFETSVFDTADGTLKDLRVSVDAFAFTAVYSGEDGGVVRYAGRRSSSEQGAWVLNAAARSPKGDSAGHNRFPLGCEEKKDGVLEVFTLPEAQQPSGGTQSL